MFGHRYPYPNCGANVATVSLKFFSGIIDAFGLILTIEEARALMMKYDIGNKSGMFAYQDFLRNFILKMKPSEENIMKRKQIRIGKSPVI